MHLIDFILTHADGRVVAARAVWCGDPEAAVDAWRAELADRCDDADAPCPVLTSAHRPTTPAEVDALRRAGQVVHEFPGWDAPDPVAIDRERIDAIRSTAGADRYPALVADAIEQGWSAEKAELLIRRAEIIAERERSTLNPPTTHDRLFPPDRGNDDNDGDSNDDSNDDAYGRANVSPSH